MEVNVEENANNVKFVFKQFKTVRQTSCSTKKVMKLCLHCNLFLLIKVFIVILRLDKFLVRFGFNVSSLRSHVQYIKITAHQIKACWISLKSFKSLDVLVTGLHIWTLSL